MKPNKNPFTSYAALQHSCYGKFDASGFKILESGRKSSTKVTQCHACFRSKILNTDVAPFPCIGATSVFNQSHYRFSMYREMCTPATRAKKSGGDFVTTNFKQCDRVQ